VVDVFFLDTSALVKRYVEESGSEWIRHITEPETGARIVVARISWVEMLSALSRLRREGRLLETIFQDGVHELSRHFSSQYRVGELTIPIAELAGELLQQYPLRAYDAVQLATAIKVSRTLSAKQASRFSFVSADKRLLDVTQMQGISILNPLDQK
jgi:predicted nucleic acid-binding protein